MPQRRNLCIGHWGNMEATICDLCGKVTPVSDRAAMLFDVIVCAAEGFEARLKWEKALLFELQHVCTDCTGHVSDALNLLKLKLRREAISAGKRTATPVGVKAKSSKSKREVKP